MPTTADVTGETATESRKRFTLTLERGKKLYGDLSVKAYDSALAADEAVSKYAYHAIGVAVEARWNEALSVALPILKHNLVLESGKYLSLQVANYKTVLAAIKLSDVLKLPGVNDQTLFRKNVQLRLCSSR